MQRCDPQSALKKAATAANKRSYVAKLGQLWSLGDEDSELHSRHSRLTSALRKRLNSRPRPVGVGLSAA
jgi:hypothetical protein